MTIQVERMKFFLATLRNESNELFISGMTNIASNEIETTLSNISTKIGAISLDVMTQKVSVVLTKGR